jgi:hypothetical protein
LVLTVSLNPTKVYSLVPIFLQNKYAPHTNSRGPRQPIAPPGGGGGHPTVWGPLGQREDPLPRPGIEPRIFKLRSEESVIHKQ